MFPENPKVRLEKVKYFGERNFEIPTISREIFENKINDHVIEIQKNLFGFGFGDKKLILKINDHSNRFEKKFKVKSIRDDLIVVGFWLFLCVLIGISFGIYYYYNNNSNGCFGPKNQFVEQNVKVLINSSEPKSTEKLQISTLPKIQSENITKTFDSLCQNCSEDEICLKTDDFYRPVCVKPTDARDPSGCGGLCEVGAQKCRKLHRDHRVFKCVDLMETKRCPANEFSCGSGCVLKTRRCDGTADCPDMRDERNCECNLNYYFHCGNKTSCLEHFKRCNGIVDCWDGFDEADCNRDCDEDKFSCVNGDCIEKHRFCDGSDDCSDKSDEPEGCGNS